MALPAAKMQPKGGFLTRYDGLESPEFGLDNTRSWRWSRGNKWHEWRRRHVLKGSRRLRKSRWIRRHGTSSWHTSCGSAPTWGYVRFLLPNRSFQKLGNFHLVGCDRFHKRALFCHDSFVALELLKDVARSLDHLVGSLAGALALVYRL